ncbi:MAG: 50S ribosomal protein L31 [bacterium]|nr:50S ribosomal protein L31 [bacterium]
MKEGIHPKYQDCTITCTCGNTFKTKSVLEQISVTVCSSCHPFFTGKEKMLDTEGRVDKFRRRYAQTQPAAK